MNQSNIIFFSNNCEASKLLLIMMARENILGYFYKICTDFNPNLPQNIRITPTIIIRGSQLYEATEAFNWLARIKQWKQNILMHKISNEQLQYFQKMNNNLVPDGNNLLGYNTTEMNAISDAFAFYNKEIKMECQEPFPQSFVTCDNVGKIEIFAPPEPENDKEKKINPSKQAKLVKQLESKRNKEVETIKQSYDSFQKDLQNRYQ